MRRPRTPLLAVLGLLALLGLCACESAPADGAGDRAREGGKADGDGPLAPGFAPIVFPHPEQARKGPPVRDKRPLEKEEAGWAEKYDLAERYAAGGFDEEALQVLNAALAEGPSKEYAESFRLLRMNLQMRRAEEVLLRVEARPVRDYVAFSRDVDFVIRFRNVSDQVVTLLAPEPGSPSSATAVSLEIKRRDRDIYATEMTRSWNQTLYLHKPGGAPIRIAPGGAYELPVRIPASEAGGPLSGLRSLEVGGVMRPTRLLKGEEWRTVRMRVRPGRVVALPDGFEPLVERPLHSMRSAVQTVAPIHLLLAAEFVPASRRVEAVEILAEALSAGPVSLERACVGALGLLRARSVGEPLRPFVRPLIEALRDTPGRSKVLMEALSAVTDVRLAPDVRFWMDWWRREAARHTAITAADERST